MNYWKRIKTKKTNNFRDLFSWGLTLLCMGALCIFPLVSVKAQSTKIDSTYTYKKGDANGIGKWYMGREIAGIMGYQGISWLERSSREKDENTARLIANIDIKESDTIADIGAGSGYHVYKMAPKAEQGLIYAVDIQKEMLAAIDEKQERTGVRNIKTVLGDEKSVKLAQNSVDKVVMVDVYHEFSYPREMMLSIKNALKDDGKIYLFEYKAEDPKVRIKKLHKMSIAQATKEMAAVGLRLEKTIDNLPLQHCMIFVKE